MPGICRGASGLANLVSFSELTSDALSDPPLSSSFCVPGDPPFMASSSCSVTSWDTFSLSLLEGGDRDEFLDGGVVGCSKP